MSPTQAASVTRNEDDDLVIRTPYNRDFVNELKELVDSHDRRWDPESRCWTVDAAYVDEIAKLLRRYFGPTRTHITKKEEKEALHRAANPNAAQAPAKKRAAAAAATIQPESLEDYAKQAFAEEAVQALTQRISSLEHDAASLRALNKTLDESVTFAQTALQIAKRQIAELQFKLTMDEVRVEASALNKGTAYAALHLTPGAPPEVVEAVWRTLMLRAHPDKEGGSEDEAKRLNAARDTILRK